MVINELLDKTSKAVNIPYMVINRLLGKNVKGRFPSLLAGNRLLLSTSSTIIYLYHIL